MAPAAGHSTGVINIGNHASVRLVDRIAVIERHAGKTANRVLMDILPRDVPANLADVSALAQWTGFQPSTCIGEGVRHFAAWHRDDYKAGPDATKCGFSKPGLP